MAKKNEAKAEAKRALLDAARNKAISVRAQVHKPQYDIAIDWGDYKKGKLVGYDGTSWETFDRPLDEVIKELAAAGATSAVIEGSFGSFDLREVARVLAVAKDLEFVVGKIPSKQTERYRREKLGLDSVKDKCEEIDALCIFEIANHQSGFVAIAKPPSTEQIAKQQARWSTHSGKALVLRSLGWPEEECDEFTKFLPAVVEPWVRETYFYDEKEEALKPGWCIPLIAAAIEVVEAGGGRDQFDRRVGYNAFGYPSFLRSNFYYGMLSHAVKKRLGVSKNEEIKSLDPALVKRVRNEEFTRHRKACRWLFARVRNRMSLPQVQPT